METKNFPSRGWMTGSGTLHLPGKKIQVKFDKGCRTQLCQSEEGDFIGLAFYTDEMTVIVPFTDIPEMCRALPGILVNQLVYFDGLYADAEKKTADIKNLFSRNEAREKAITEAKRLGCKVQCFDPNGNCHESDEMWQYVYIPSNI